MEDSKPRGWNQWINRISQSAVIVCAALLAMGNPQNVLAKTHYGMGADGGYYDYAPEETSRAPVGVAATCSLLTLGGMAALALSKEKGLVSKELEDVEREVDRLVQYKQQFLDGVPSDRSISASLSKAMNKRNPNAKPGNPEDEFEKNVKAFLKEEEEKSQKKKKEKKLDSKGKGVGSAVLENPEDGKKDDWTKDVVIDTKPATLADEDLKRLQKMFGGDLPKF
eukprot:CAMPEP_0113665094 /NCGR_PEP_ID=MMETSP0038_2-20120614/2107_1 /TAXON_ID=2898 /ORGANISM="Cryptomonas paramecium" /LENGTH=223 /DNA_ID=CAMNT_0000580395 /DNA_START=176 /DNA_END=847 /DNA_ORIENTATION=- /assembly_acc=CAM_ASM_000170